MLTGSIYVTARSRNNRWFSVKKISIRRLWSLLRESIYSKKLKMEDRQILHFGFLINFPKTSKFCVQLVEAQNLWSFWRKKDAPSLTWKYQITLLRKCLRKLYRPKTSLMKNFQQTWRIDLNNFMKNWWKVITLKYTKY